MSVTRRTVSLPKSLAEEIDRMARKGRVSFSATLASLVDEALRRRKSVKTLLKSLGAGESGLPDLGTQSEKHLDEIARKFVD